MLVTAYHTHRQTLVFVFVLFAAAVGRSLRPGTSGWLTVVWVGAVIGVHLWTVYLRNEIAIRFYPIQQHQTPVAIAAVIVLGAVLLHPATSRRLAGWPWPGTGGRPNDRAAAPGRWSEAAGRSSAPAREQTGAPVIATSEG